MTDGVDEVTFEDEVDVEDHSSLSTVLELLYERLGEFGELVAVDRRARDEHFQAMLETESRTRRRHIALIVVGAITYALLVGGYAKNELRVACDRRNEIAASFQTAMVSAIEEVGRLTTLPEEELNEVMVVVGRRIDRELPQRHCTFW